MLVVIILVLLVVALVVILAVILVQQRQRPNTKRSWSLKRILAHGTGLGAEPPRQFKGAP